MGVRTDPPRVATTRTSRIAIPEKRADPELLTPEHRAWRSEVLRRAGYRCQAKAGGGRCFRTMPTYRLFADHIVERRDGGAALDPANGQCLCGEHHTRKTMKARVARLSLPYPGGDGRS